MSVNLNIGFTRPTKKKIRDFEKNTDNFYPILNSGMLQVMEFVLNETKLNLTGRILNRGDGRLVNSMEIDVSKASEKEALGRIGDLKSSVKYARIHDEGGVITPKNKPNLVFQIGGRWISTKRVVIPERMYLRLAYLENRPKILTILQKHILKQLRTKI